MTGHDTPSGEETSFDLKSLIGMVYRRFWLIVTGFLVVFLAVAYITFTATPVYKASTTIQLGTNQENVIDLGSVLGGIVANTAAIDTEVMVISSKSLLTKVAERQKLIEDPEFNWTLVERKPGLIDGLVNPIKKSLGMRTERVDPYAGLSAEEREAAIMESVVEALTNRVSVSRVGTTYLLTVTVMSTSPETSARLANAVADQYRVQQLDTKLDATRRATEWLGERVSGLRDEVAEKENRVEVYRAQNGLDTAMGTTLAEQKIADLTKQKTQLDFDLSQARARYENMRRQIDSGTGIDGISEVLDSPLISRLKEQLSVLRGRVAELETKLGPQHPELIGARNEVRDVERQMKAEVNRIADNLESEVKAKRDQVNAIQARINQANGQLRDNSIASVRLRELERDAETSRVLYEEFIARSKETSVQDDLVQADAVILSAASVPNRPAAPKKKLNLLIGAVLGAAIGAAMAIIAEMFDAKISSTEDIERKLGVSSIGSVPLIRASSLFGLGQTNPADYLVENPLSAYAESVRYLRAAIAFSDLDSETKTVAITSSLPDEGKTSLTLSLGRMSAMSGSRTIVIDGDFRRRQLTEAAGMSPEIGFIEHLFGAGQLSDAIQKDSKTMLDILPLSQSGHTPHDVFGTRAFDDLLSRLRSMYDLILIDTGPLLLMAEARVVAGKVDKTILMVRWRHSTRAAVKQSLNLLRSFNADVLGATLNMVDLNRRRHHRDPGASYKAYRKYYQMESKKSVFGFDLNGGKRKKGGKGPVAMQTPPEHAKSTVEEEVPVGFE
ncbi:chain length determinant family protein [Hyphomonas adhaerens MHS-3]|uniref:Chain length determinant family protein n=3 Tax=Hyphomonadaceae TaxID=69657 RepID=A0A069E7P1_9PROT|nr:chain length determinant family protein [Hyphomonas adhaerens MHS-3]MBB41465.1 lipopolysaccharide biosynthesis protein [Hyphomonas sp.]HAE28841.1 lipopolysaccharide biosynthesis protein [Hyphomonas adhaerens]|tara:strand:- start:35469 stop:37826 length:2358 start_codon:yes stop_codon:yes gene_type:complete